MNSFRGKIAEIQSEHNRLKVKKQSLQHEGWRLNLGRENASISLVVPLLSPLVWADVAKDLLEVVAGLVILSLELGASMEVDVVLPAVPEIFLIKLTHTS